MIKKEYLEVSEKDSARFHLNVFRATLDTIKEKQIFNELISNEVDVAILRAPTAVSHKIERMRRFGIEPIHADTLVYYEVDLNKYQPNPLRNDLEFSQPTVADKAIIDKLVDIVFEGYTSHYHANPLFGADDILSGYREWAMGYLSECASRKLWVARKNGQIVAFACCRLDHPTMTCEGVLYGVHPDHSGCGIYGDLIRYTQASFKDTGHTLMRVSTQIGNFAVQKVWSREGFHLAQAYDTYHFNTLFSPKNGLVKTFNISFDADQATAFGRLSGDMNPVHFDDTAARQSGFDARICHGILPAAELSRIFGMECPGPGTLFLGLQMTFLRPLYQGAEYRIQIRYAPTSSDGSFQVAAAIIRDTENNVCILAYSDLRHMNE